MSVARVAEIKAASRTSFEDAVRQGITRSSKTPENGKTARIWNRQVMEDDLEITKLRVHLEVTIILED